MSSFGGVKLHWSAYWKRTSRDPKGAKFDNWDISQNIFEMTTLSEKNLWSLGDPSLGRRNDRPFISTLITQYTSMMSMFLEC